MEPNFITDRPKLSDDEINKHKNFDLLVKQFKERSLKQAQGDESWWKNKKIKYSTIIAGVTVICTVSYFTLFKNKPQQQSNEKIITSSSINKKTKAPFIHAPSSKLKRPYSSYKVNNAKGGNITHSTSSKINIPQNTFVNKNGKDVIGDVTIEYREFHDVGDIVVSGIPMAYDSSGTHYNLESAGMFDIIGTQNGEPVFIKPDKTIQVELASYNDESRFNQYYLDTALGNWQYMKRDEAFLPASSHTKSDFAKNNDKGSIPTQNKKLVILKNDLDVVIPKRIDSVTKVYTKKAEQLPRASAPLKPSQATKGRPSFKLDGSYTEFPELVAFNNMVFEVGPENTNYTNELHQITWSDVKVTQGPVKGKNYYLNLSYRNRSEKLIVYPVLTGTDFDNAKKLYENKFTEYETLVEKRKLNEQKLLAEMQAKQQAYMNDLKKKQQEYDLEKTRLNARAQMQEQNDLSANFKTMSNSTKASRLFSVSQFGIYNSDCPHLAPSDKSITPHFVSEKDGQAIFPDFIYLIDHKTKTVYAVNAQNGIVINYTLDNPYSVCLFKQNKLYLCNKEAFSQGIAGGNKQFLVKSLVAESENLLDFKKALEI